MAMLEGTLSKWTNVMKGWQYRWFVLDENAGLLSYYTSKEKMMKGVRRGCVRLKCAVIGIDDQEDNNFTITVDHKTFHFQARDGDEREKWVRRLEDTIRRHANRGRLWGSQSTFYIGGYSLGSSKHINSYEVLDKRISEADAYLQLMIDQINRLDIRIADLSDAEDRAKCKIIQENCNAMLDHIKHSIVTLQIAKNMANPINGIYHGPSNSNIDNNKIISSLIDDDVIDLNKSDILSPISISPIQGGLECGRELVRRQVMSPSDIATNTTSLALAVPETSYSSSEGEDDFYDANDDTFTSYGSSPCTTRGFSIETSPTRESPQLVVGLSTPSTSLISDVASNTIVEEKYKEHPLQSRPVQSANAASKRHAAIPFRSDGSIDYDALYEEEDDTDISMESHGSMVSHLLSQVKIGMDLTKVVLPTFILERRSLLEMYADYFAHPDLFLKIADLDDPRDRIVQVCRWYLSAYHAGRKSSVAKKPYNPIIGEIFQCYWDVPNDNSDPKEVVTDGPIPWCKRSQLTFLAEQVSHHPPISCFYAEQYNKKISFSAHVWTKSKFLGLSIGVHNIGEGIVTLVDRNEEYFVSFPNGYGRSILTVPWIELGGSVTIKCPQTGYHAVIEFLTKPFYGGKRNKISAEIFAPNDKKSFISIAGEWSGLMEAKWNDSSSNNKTEVFVDVNQIPIFKKQVRPIVEQEEFESRRVWKEVTAGLKLNDIERATNAKCNIEQKQREEAKLRKDSESGWEHKYFTPIGDSWVYSKPLKQRICLQEKENKS